MVVTTERLVLTPVTTDDVGDLVRLHNDANVAFWYAGAWSVEQACTWARRVARQWAEDGVGKWMARRRSDGTLIGRGGLSTVTIGGTECLEVGWALRDHARGHGHASEIGQAGLDFAYDSLAAPEVVAFTEVHNGPSIAVMKRLGMKHRGLIERPGLIRGQPRTHEHAAFVLYAHRPAGQRAPQP